MKKPEYHFSLHAEYYYQGFFNLGLLVDDAVSSHEGYIKLFLGDSGASMRVYLNRSLNHNGTPRIMGGEPLKMWFQRHYNLDDDVVVTVFSPTELGLNLRNTDDD